MLRSLCLLIGKDPLPNGINYMRITVPVDEARKLDAYTMNNYSNSEAIRIRYAEHIDAYLKQNEEAISKIGKNYRGAIVIIDETDIMNPRKLRVLYKGDSKTINTLIYDLNFMRILAREDQECESRYLKLFSQYMIDSLLNQEGQNYTASELKIMTRMWKEDLKAQKYGTDKVRKVLKRYKEYQKMLSDEKNKRR